MPAKNNKIEEVSTVTVAFFNALKDKANVRIAAIINKIEDKETPYGTAKRFKGDFAVEADGITYRAKNLFCPNSVRDSIINAAAKVGKWSSLELVIVVNKSVTTDEKTEITRTDYSSSFTTNPRSQKPTVLALLDL